MKKKLINGIFFSLLILGVFSGLFKHKVIDDPKPIGNNIKNVDIKNI